MTSIEFNMSLSREELVEAHRIFQSLHPFYLRPGSWLGGLVLLTPGMAFDFVVTRTQANASVFTWGSTLAWLVPWMYVSAIFSFILWKRWTTNFTRVWRNNPQVLGPFTFSASDTGFSISNDGCRLEYYWATVGSVRESKNLFLLLAHTGSVFAIVPKRALPSDGAIAMARGLFGRIASYSTSPSN